MAPDLLSTIRHEIDERLSELRPLLAEREQLLVAADALIATGGGDSALVSATTRGPIRNRRGTRAARRGSAAGAIKLVVSSSAEAGVDGKAVNGSSELIAAVDGERAISSRRRGAKPKSKFERAARGAAREAILAALGHGSHTVSELAVVTAMSAANINGNLRRLLAEGVVVKTEREGKAAWALAKAII